MIASTNCVNLIAEFEGFRSTAYQDVGGVWTIGFGHTGGVKRGDVCTREQALEWLGDDIRVAAHAVNIYDDVYHWTQNEFDALTSFAYNIGGIHQLTKQGTRTKAEIAAKMLEYNHVAGNVVNGLTRRRQVEHDLFLSQKTESGEDEVTLKEAYNVIAKAVIKGDFGNGHENRKNAIYEKIRAEVNRIMKK